ncbi:MAG: HypC/HybG/HupF family hydrogenase formation chaperone [Planctomycetes bacterium]|nr:HypC/HybG/HupF family hydrogenase formation chaperone [Planctomycetota bacterium]
MCLAVPGKITGVTDSDDPAAGRIATVDFQGNRVEVSLALVPEAGCGSWVLVHAGFALNVLDEREALETWRWLEAAELVDGVPEDLKALELAPGDPAPGDPPAAGDEPAAQGDPAP